MTSIEKYKADIKRLSQHGGLLMRGLFLEVAEFYPEDQHLVKMSKNASKDDKWECFTDNYNSWYNESLALVRQLIPSRYEEFCSYYRDDKRKSLTAATYTISDFLIGTYLNDSWGEQVAGPKHAIAKFQQQVLIIKSLENRFESSLYDIKQLLQADLFDSEIDVAKELLKNGFLRASGAVVGVVLEKHLCMVCQNHKLTPKKKAAGINELNQLLKDNDAIEVPLWRSIQYLGDIRNLCDHGKEREPKKEEIEDLISGTIKVTKTLF